MVSSATELHVRSCDRWAPNSQCRLPSGSTRGHQPERRCPELSSIVGDTAVGSHAVYRVPSRSQLCGPVRT